MDKNSKEKIKELFLSKNVFLLDGDGTLYLWDKAFKDSNLLIKKLQELDKKFIILSNNDSESKKNRLNFLMKVLDIKLNERQLLLPNDIIEDFLFNNKIKSFDGLISDDFKKELISKGFKYDEVNPQIVIIGFDVNLKYEKIERAINHVNRGIKFILTHIDPLCPYKDGKEIPDAGIMVKLVSEPTKKMPYKTFGKPYRSTIAYITRKYGYTKKEMLMIGDRINTDIKMANESKISSIWITNGDNMVKADYSPNEIVSSINELYGIIKDL
ncbi:MAG: HAD-IIA family hydrolase [Candidatus Parvarchaeum sp.]